jgi:hypothetical protein
MATQASRVKNLRLVGLADDTDYDPTARVESVGFSRRMENRQRRRWDEKAGDGSTGVLGMVTDILNLIKGAEIEYGSPSPSPPPQQQEAEEENSDSDSENYQAAADAGNFTLTSCSIPAILANSTFSRRHSPPRTGSGCGSGARADSVIRTD